MKNASRITIGLFLFIFAIVASAWAEDPQNRDTEKGKKENIPVLQEITVVGTPYNPINPVNTLYGTQYNMVTEEKIKEQNAYDFQSTLRDVPGVMFQSKNLVGSQTSHSLYIRGRGASHPSSDIVIEFDGVPRYGALFGQVLGDGIAIPTIGGIELFKSPQPSEFGSGYAAINVLPKYMTKEGQEIVHSFNGGSYATFNESLSGGIKQGPYDLYVSQSWLSTDGHVDHSRAQQQNYYANTGYQINSMWNIRLLANYVKSQTLAPMPNITPNGSSILWPGAERFDTETMLTTLTLSHKHEQVSGYLKAYLNETTFDLLQELQSANGQRYAGVTGGLRSRQEISLYGIRAKEKFHFWPGGEILAGVDLDETELKNTERTYSGLAVAGINGGRAERVWDFPNTLLTSPYLAVNQFIGKQEGFHIIPSAGFRYYHHSEFKDNSAAQVGLVAGYKHTDININYSRGVNYPSPVVLMNMVLTGSTVSNPSQYWKEIKPEIVDHYEIGLTHTWPETASLKAAAFYDKGKDRVQAYMYGTIPTQFNDPIGQYEIKGLELTGSVTPVKNLEFSAGATWMDAKATGSNNIEVDQMPYTPRFALQGGATWKFLDHYKLFMDVQHFSNLYASTVSRTGTFNYTQLTDSYKLNDITLCNARLSYSFDYKTLRLNDSEIFFTVNNIANQHYEYAKGYSMPGTTFFGGYTVKFR
ncbi:MAG: TonB-dependent receptor [Smithellaceae bacterium]